MITFPDERALARMAVRLGAASVRGWSAAERRLAGPDAQAAAAGPGDGEAERVRALIRAGGDPLGEAFCRLRAPATRRAAGQTFTPGPVIEAMLGWAARGPAPARVADPGVGSARFLVAAGRRWPEAALVGAETDPLAAMIGRATLAAAGLAPRAAISLTDYRAWHLPRAEGPTLFLGNPPYVRHHQVPGQWKDWLRTTAAGLGLPASGLAGLHAHFFLATAGHAAPGDMGVLVTAAEWLDVNYGALVRSLLLGPLGGEAVHVLDPALAVFPDALVSSAITCFRPGTRPGGIRLRRVTSLGDLADLSGGAAVPADVLRASRRWGPLLPALPARGGAADEAGAGGGRAGGTIPGGRVPGGRVPAGLVELGELCRVHRGQVTGANRVWITARAPGEVPARFLYPAVTRARELFQAGDTLATAAGLRSVIDLPADLSELTAAELALVREFLAAAAAAGAAGTYIARHRSPWWRVRLAGPAPILATYMARRPPAFVRNQAGVRHVNIAHGIYPRQPLPAQALDGLAAYLRRRVRPGDGRTYAGGLTKFEPKEMERLRVPAPDLLPAYALDPAVVPHV